MLIRKIKYSVILLFGIAQFLNAQYYFFGRNKVQYNDFEWKVLKTEHFNIYYYNDFEEMAEIGAYFAEEAYEELKVKFNYYVSPKIPLIFYNTHIHFQQTNTTPGFIPEGVGGFFEFMKGRVVIPYLGSQAAFRHVIKHELVHVFMTLKLSRILREHRLISDRFPPLWFVEGLAEYWSTDWDTQAEMVMRDATINNYFVGIKDMSQIYGSFLMYKEGQNFLQFIAEKYGEQIVFYLIEDFWQYENFNELLEYLLGKSIEEIDKEWLYHLKQKYYPLLKDNVPPGNTGTQITDFGFNFSPAYYSSDGKDYIFFIANRNGYSSLYKQELRPELKKEDRPKPEVILQGEKEEIFESFHLLEPSLDVSKDGIIAFVTKSGATDAIHFYSVKEDNVLNTFQQKNLISINSPRWSQDGSKILFQAIDNRGYSDIWLYDYQLDSLTRITDDYYSDRTPNFSSDGKAIIFSSDRTAGKYKGKFNLFKYDFLTGQIDYMTYCNADISSPQYSPLSGELYFICDQNKTQNLWKLKFSDDNLPVGMDRVTDYLTSLLSYTFVSPSKFVAAAFENFSFQLYETEIGSLADSVKDFVQFNFENAGGAWAANKLIVDPAKDKISYKNEYSIDFAQSVVSTDPIYGTSGGAVLSLSDLFSDDNYFFLIYNTAEVQSDFLKSFNVAISRINIKNRTNYAYGVFHFSGRRYDIRDSDEYFYERSFGGYFSLLYPMSKFQRLEATVTVANSDKEVVSGVIERKALLVSNSLSYVLDNSLWGPSGPLDGTRIRFLLGVTNDVKFSNVNYFTAIADVRKYIRLSYPSCLALRAALFYNEGKEARRYFMGGSWDLRGWPRWSIRGEKLWLTSVELRFPLVDLVYLKFPFFGLGFPNIRGAFFFDSGGAWDTEYRETLGSIGGGLRFSLFNVFTFRYDIGKKIENNFKDFQPGLFYQFFFGWDF